MKKRTQELLTFVLLGLRVLCVSSKMHNGLISAHWYSLPTGASPLTQLAQHMPVSYIQAGVLALFVIYGFFKSMAPCGLPPSSLPSFVR
jgi:hypothetical protein